MTKLACFDPGHSHISVNRSPDRRYYEWLGCQDICEKAMLLVNQIPGLEGMLTKETWEVTTLADRVKKAHDAGAHLFLSQHTNAAGSGGWHSANGVGIYPYPDRDLDLAEIALRISLEKLDLNNRGIRPRNFYVTRETRMPAVLFETGFHTHREDVAKLKTHEFRYLAAEVLVRTACEYLGIPFIVKNTSALAPVHYVVSGNTMSGIARHYSIPLASLVEWNSHIPDPAHILAEHGGDVIFVASPTQAQVEYGLMRREYILCKMNNKTEEYEKKIGEMAERLLEQESTLDHHKHVGDKIISYASKLL